MTLSKRFPKLERPDNLEGTTSEETLTYIEDLEQRVATLGAAADLLMEMDVFPDILSRLDGMVEEARAAQASEDQALQF